MGETSNNTSQKKGESQKPNTLQKGILLFVENKVVELIDNSSNGPDIIYKL